MQDATALLATDGLPTLPLGAIGQASSNLASQGHTCRRVCKRHCR